jgi:hypothetical protein
MIRFFYLKNCLFLLDWFVINYRELKQSKQEVILRIDPLGKLGHFDSTADIFCLHRINQLSKWADPEYNILVLQNFHVLTYLLG